MLFQRIALLIISAAAMYDGPKFAHRKPSKLENDKISKPSESLRLKKPSWYTKPFSGSNDMINSKPFFSKVSPMNIHTDQKHKVGVKRVIVTKIVFVKPNNSKPNGESLDMEKIKPSSDSLKMRKLHRMTEKMMKDPKLKGEWWPIGKPKKENPSNEKDEKENSTTENDEKDSDSKQNKMIAEFYKRKLQRTKNKQFTNSNSVNYKPQYIKKQPDDMQIMDSENDILDFVEENNKPRFNYFPRIQALRREKQNDEDPEFRVPFKKRSFFQNLKRKVEKIFNSSLEDPVARFLVALSFGLMTTLCVFAVASLVKLFFPKLFNDFEGESVSGSLYEYGDRSHGNVQYTPLPQ